MTRHLSEPPEPDFATAASREAVGATTIEGTRRPDLRLMLYYAFLSLLLGPFFPIGWILGYVRYHSLEYRFDGEGVTMSWGVLFRREISLTYARLQDIHLASNLVERWLGLARIQLQTAAGSAVAEMTIEGLPDFEGIRDLLYSKMRRSRGRQVSPGPPATASPAAADPGSAGLEEVVAALRQTAAELEALRRDIGRQRSGER